MDRLSFVIAALLFAGCGEEGPTQPLPSRVVAVAAEEPAADDLCDATPGTRLTLPPLAEGHRAAPAEGRRWVNVWATWCQPCVEELPLLTRFAERLEADGTPVSLRFVSADADDEAIARFEQSHGDVPESVRVADPQAIAAWGASLGLGEAASLPIHVLTDADGRVVCARAGAISESDYPAIRATLR
ncbi:MAG: TlpA disulfide reductase family protein [Myxococcota bacterium]|nr:TlpA disulfide reductase family protein [Myxococcota bacterium]